MVAENAGVPTVTVHTTGFETSARSTGEGSGLPNLPTAEYPGAIDTHSPDAIKKNVEEVLLDRVVKALIKSTEKAGTTSGIREPGPRDIVFKGSFEEVNDYYYKNLWSDGLPIVPPTLKKVEEFLKFTDRSPNEVIGLLPPARREATVWNIAVNGVMAGCRPEYMPILIAVVEAIGDPHFGLQHAGSTAGWTPLIILNGPINRQLDFNDKVGVLRPGNQANTSVGRFLRLFMRNVPRFLPGSSDMGTFGGNFFLVLAENEVDSPWHPLSVDLGFKAEANLVTVNSILSMSIPNPTQGAKAKDHLDMLAGLLQKQFRGNVMTFGPEMHPMIVMTPVIANLLAKEGVSKKDVRQYIFEKARVTAREFDADGAGLVDSVCNLVKAKKLPPLFCESEDPNRMLPVFHSPDELFVIVSGDPTRNRVFAANQLGYQGCATTREIRLPKNWGQLMAELSR